MYIRQVNKELLGLSVCKLKTENERLRIKKIVYFICELLSENEEIIINREYIK